MKTLYLARHAKSSWKYKALRDFERPLKNSGKKDAEIMANHLKDKMDCPEYWVSSPALRAWETALIFARVLGCAEDQIKEQKSIYASSVNEMLAVIYSLPQDKKEVIMFGHEPTLSYLCEYLSNHSFEKVPTSGVVALTFNVQQWKQIKEHTASLNFFIYPKMFIE